MTDCITDRTVSICTDGHPDIGYWTWVAGFAALRGAGKDDGQQDHGDDDGGAEEQPDGAVREGPTSHE